MGMPQLSKHLLIKTFLKVIETHNLSNPDFKLIIRTI